jgi:hypothetical protein
MSAEREEIFLGRSDCNQFCPMSNSENQTEVDGNQF